MPTARLRPLAREDLFDLWSYVAADNEVAADRLVARLSYSFNLAASNPRMGRARGDMGPGVRHLIVGNYVVFYRIVAGGIEIGRIMHGARNIAPEDIWPSFDPQDLEG